MSDILGSFWLRVCGACVVAAAFAARVSADDKITYDDQLAPIFRQRCSSCHNPTAKKADLDVTNYLSLTQGGASGAVIEPGDAGSSYLFSLVNHEAEPYMPQNSDKLPDAEIDLLRRWIDGGALENQGSKAAQPKSKMRVATDVKPGARPAVIPMPPRMVLEPYFELPRPPMARSLATSPWAPLVAVASQHQVLLYNTSTLELMGVYPFPEGQPNIVRFSRDGQLLLVGGGRPAASGTVVVWDITTGERVAEVGNELDVVLAADISADHKQIALGGPPRKVRVYSTETGQLQYEITKHTDWVLAVEFSPDGVLLATADRSNGLYMWEANTGHEYLTLNGHTAAVTAVSWRPDSNLLASGSEDGTVRLWEPENGTQVKNWNAKAAVLALEFTRDGRLVTCGRDQVTRLWDQNGKPLMESAPIGDIAVSTTFCDESLCAITGSWAGPVQVYKAEGAAVLGSLATNPPPLAQQLATAQQRLQEKSAVAAPLIEAARKAEAELASAQAAVAAAEDDAHAKQALVDQVTAEASQLTTARAAQDDQRTKIAAEFANRQGAQPAVAEALRHLTEALGKLPQDAELASLHAQLTEQLNAGESQMNEYQAKLGELSATIEATDARLKEIDAALEAARTAAATAIERAANLQAQSASASKAAEAARQAAQSVETEVALLGKAVTRWQDEIAFRDSMAAMQAKLEAANKSAAERQAELDQAKAQLATAKSSADAALVKLGEATQGIEQIQADIRKARGIP